MNIENYIPESSWTGNAKELIKRPEIIIGAGIALPFLAITGPLSILGGPLLQYTLWAFLIKRLIEMHKKKKIEAIIDAFPNRYSESDLLKMYDNNRSEFKRLYKLSSDEFFRKYVNEQADHKKAQELIKILHIRIEEMRLRLKFMEEKGKKYREEIEILKEEISLFEEIVSKWKRGDT